MGYEELYVYSSVLLVNLAKPPGAVKRFRVRGSRREAAIRCGKHVLVVDASRQALL